MAINTVTYQKALLEYKTLSQVECLYILLYLVKHRMGGYKQINDGYKQLTQDTSEHFPIKNRHVKEVIINGWVKVNKLGIMSLDHSVDQISYLLTRIDWFDDIDPRMYNFENSAEYYITNDLKKVYTVRDYRGYKKGQFATLKPAVELKNSLNSTISNKKLIESLDPMEECLNNSVPAGDDFGNSLSRWYEANITTKRKRIKRNKIVQKRKNVLRRNKKVANNRKNRKISNNKENALEYLNRRKNIGLFDI